MVEEKPILREGDREKRPCPVRTTHSVVFNVPDTLLALFPSLCLFSAPSYLNTFHIKCTRNNSGPAALDKVTKA